MKDASVGGIADSKGTVAALYEDSAVARLYLQKRTQHAWQRLLHRTQVDILSRLVSGCGGSVLELAPGPARLGTDIRGVRRGLMIENSEEMIRLARHRLQISKLDSVWSVVKGSAFDLEPVVGGMQFKLAYTFRFIRHFRDSDRGQLYRQIHRSLSAGGVLVFDVVNKAIRDTLDSRRACVPVGELPVFDATYTPDSIRRELRDHGFLLVDLHPVINHFWLQSWLSHKLQHRAPFMLDGLVGSLESVPSRAPLEWVAVCTKI